MRSLLALAVAAAFAAPLAASADAPAPIKPLRQLVYDVTYSARTTHEVKSSGFNGGFGAGTSGDGNSSVAAGSGAASQYMNGDDRGKLAIDVIAATTDGGLVVDASFTGTVNVQPKTRIAIFEDGRISADPAHPLVPAVARMLPLIARGFIANRDVSAGSTWSIPAPAPSKGSTTYRVQSSDGQRARIAIEGVLSMPGPTGFEESDQGTTTYATDLVSPISYDLTARIRRQLGIDQSMTTSAHITATLVSDSFAKR
jgi:opacity protein-like surface antigen